MCEYDENWVIFLVILMFIEYCGIFYWGGIKLILFLLFL